MTTEVISSMKIEIVKLQGTIAKLRIEALKNKELNETLNKLTNELYKTKQQLLQLKYLERKNEVQPKNKPENNELIQGDFWIEQALKTLPDKTREEAINTIRNVSKAESIGLSIKAAIELVHSGLKKGIVVITSAYEFDPAYNQRPIALAREACRSGYFVIFVSWVWSREEKTRKNGWVFGGGLLQIDRFELNTLLDIIAKNAQKQAGYFILTLPSEDFVAAIPKFQSSGIRTIYDAMDDWEEFHSVGQAVWWSQDLERRATLAADLVFAVSPTLQRKLSLYGRNVQWVANGMKPTSSDQRFISNRSLSQGQRIQVGYFGHLTEAWFDWHGIFSLAESCPEIEINIIGYGEPDWVKTRLKELHNITFIGFVPSDDLWKIVTKWHIGLIPFLPTTLTQSVDPIKIYEYLNFGLPVIASGMPHLADYPETILVDHWSNAAEIIKAQYYKISYGSLDYSSMAEFCDRSTWSNRLKEMFGNDA